MRKNSKDQLLLNPARHEMAKEQRSRSGLWRILSDGAMQRRAASGLSAERALRCAILNDRHGFSYSQLAFHLLKTFPNGIKGCTLMLKRVFGAGRRRRPGFPELGT
ncbi:MAG: hypothetical protein V3T83_19450 [Acidobacteriota bacterium]